MQRKDLRTAQALIQNGNESQFSLALKLPIIDELVKERDNLILAMNNAKKEAIIKAAEPYIPRIHEIEEQLSSMMIMAGGATATESN